VSYTFKQKEAYSRPLIKRLYICVTFCACLHLCKNLLESAHNILSLFGWCVLQDLHVLLRSLILSRIYKTGLFSGEWVHGYLFISSITRVLCLQAKWCILSFQQFVFRYWIEMKRF